MAQQKPLPPLTPRAREVVNYVVNTVALGTHDNDGEIGAVAKALKTTPNRLLTIVRKLEKQGWLIVKDDFLYPSVAALKLQNPHLSDREASKVLWKLR